MGGAAPHDVDLVPGMIQHLGDHAMRIADAFGAEVTDAGLHGDTAVGLDDEHRVEADAAADEATGSHSDAARLGAAALGHGFALLPVEELHALIQRFFDVAARDIGALAV